MQHELEMVTLEELVPKDHLLRKIEAAVNFEFIREQVAHLYCTDNGRPALDPVVMFKLLFVGYLFGVRSELPTHARGAGQCRLAVVRALAAD